MQGKSKEKGSSKNSSPVEPAPIAALAEHRAPALTLRQAMATRAQRLVVKQFGRVSAGKGAETVGMKLLRSVCADLSQAGSVDKLLEVLGEEEEGAVSTFEFLNSGAVQQLKHYLLGKLLHTSHLLFRNCCINFLSCLCKVSIRSSSRNLILHNLSTQESGQSFKAFMLNSAQRCLLAWPSPVTFSMAT